MALNGFLNLATGLASFVGWSLNADQVPEYLRLSPVVRTSGILSVLLGGLLLFLGKGLFERRRRAWNLSLLVLAILLANNVYRNLYRGTAPPTAWVTLLLLVGLLVFRKHFRMKIESRLGYGQVVALVSLVFAFTYAIGGSYMLRTEFNGIAGIPDAVYFAVVTYSTVGYGDVTPKTETAKLFTATLIPIGLAAFATALTALIGPAMERRMKGVLNLMQKIQHSTNHVIVCGLTNVSETVIEELQKQGTAYLIVENREDLVEQLRAKGHDVLQGDATRKEVLREASFDNATAVVSAFDSDSENILVAVTAKELRDARPKCTARIVVRIEDEENIQKALRVGADDVVSPSTLGGQQMVARAKPETDDGPPQ
jgi:voltage-gated potassium channel